LSRVVLKLSGEALASSASDETIDASTVDFLANVIATAMSRGGLELAVVVGGGNIWRGATGAMAGMNRANSDIMGMLGTVINALALQDAIETHGCATRVMSAIGMDQVAEPYIRRRAVRHLEKGRVVRGWIGILPQRLEPERAAQLGYPADSVVIDDMYIGSPAMRAGLAINDRILTIDGKPVRGSQDTLVQIANHKPGSVVKITGTRGTQPFSLELTAIDTPTAR
jgi:S1-C subfamily serine protease